MVRADVTILDLYRIRSQRNALMQPVEQVAWVLRKLKSCHHKRKSEFILGGLGFFQNTSQCEGDSAGSIVKGIVGPFSDFACLPFWVKLPFCLEDMIGLIGALPKWLLALLANRFSMVWFFQNWRRLWLWITARKTVMYIAFSSPLRSITKY
jgi:hypothetical protein